MGGPDGVIRAVLFAVLAAAGLGKGGVMIAYVTLGTNDLARGAAFYDALAGELGVPRMMENDRFIAWAVPGGPPGIGLTRPFDGASATAGNGVMVALSANSREQVDRLHALALRLGGRDEGAPGLRDSGFYTAYFRDLDGNKLNVIFLG